MLQVVSRFLHYLMAVKSLRKVSDKMSSIDRFHSRDRWPQWGGETIRNI